MRRRHWRRRRSIRNRHILELILRHCLYRVCVHADCETEDAEASEDVGDEVGFTCALEGRCHLGVFVVSRLGHPDGRGLVWKVVEEDGVTLKSRI